MNDLLRTLILSAGVAQLVLIVASLAIPRMLGWREETARLRPLLRQVFWTYAAYIWATNVCFGLVSALAPDWLLEQSPLAAAVTGFITLYWGGRLAIQFVYFDRADMPAGAIYRVAEACLVGLFLFLAVAYGVATARNLGMISP